ncbi:hypothetical protein [Pseudoneobacillus rhizosphaerae]|uniref:Uncharacterized protein n=1 Tax=Pseudoneobacillus rhizosphaerae TaxID=2880968 RepID=A0A9C7G8G0_9BACI|nr:hypothetical protein [Pseudoneobacillus rhizosphaerae]CAG9607739.1 hypothetical protein NEOCIP111885_01431 [Pseudoneobacillus rhizosphaerae]
MLVKDVYLESLRYEETSLAHCIHHLLEEKKISLEDDMTEIDLELVNPQKVAEMIRNNVLGFRKLNIYSLKRNRNEFVFIFATRQQEAIQHFTETYHQQPLNCLEFQLDFQLIRGNEIISFRDMRKEFMSFPAVVGCYRK